MATGRKSDFTLPTFDSIFSTQEQRDDAKLAKIRDIPLNEIDDFPDHPFKVRDDEDMMQLVESIKERGVITPANTLNTRQWQTKIDLPTQSSMVIAKRAFQLFEQRYGTDCKAPCKSGNSFLIKGISKKSIKQTKGNPKRVAFCNFLICSQLWIIINT